MNLSQIKETIVELPNDMEGNFLELLTCYHALCRQFHDLEIHKEINKPFTINEMLIYDCYRLAFSFFATHYSESFEELSPRAIIMFCALPRKDPKDCKIDDTPTFEICREQVKNAHFYFDKQRHDDICIRGVLNSLGVLMWREQINVEAILLHYSNRSEKQMQD